MFGWFFLRGGGKLFPFSLILKCCIIIFLWLHWFLYYCNMKNKLLGSTELVELYNVFFTYLLMFLYRPLLNSLSTELFWDPITNLAKLYYFMLHFISLQPIINSQRSFPLSVTHYWYPSLLRISEEKSPIQERFLKIWVYYRQWK